MLQFQVNLILSKILELNTRFRIHSTPMVASPKISTHTHTVTNQIANGWVDDALAGNYLPKSDAMSILTDPSLVTLGLVNAVYRIRYHYWQNRVSIHIINNIQNGGCIEDCGYCAQAKSSDANIDSYGLKSDAEILEEARQAHLNGAFRYCMVTSGRGPTAKRLEKLCQLIRTIKATIPIEVCLSAGIMDAESVAQLKCAGLDRLNHNLNTSRRWYPSLCTTHTYDDRMATLTHAKGAGIELCSGLIVGTGESIADIIDVIYTLRDLETRSIPINFLVPIDGNPISAPDLTPDFCLRVLILARLVNPSAEIRVGAGRELHFRHQQILAMYVANSLFLDGYLNTHGQAAHETLQMLMDSGFDIDSEIPINELMATPTPYSVTMKRASDLRPARVHR